MKSTVSGIISPQLTSSSITITLLLFFLSTTTSASTPNAARQINHNDHDLSAIKILNPRQETPAPVSEFIDPVTQPYSDSSSCWHWSSPPPDLPDCPVVENPACSDEDAKGNSTNPPKCGKMQYRRDCYCATQNTITCAWYGSSWPLWWETEDWLSKQCNPTIPIPGHHATIDFTPLPSCARNCLDDATFQSGCTTQNTNCFCSYGNLYDCHKNCETQSEYDAIAAWLSSTCSPLVNPSIVDDALQTGLFTILDVHTLGDNDEGDKEEGEGKGGEDKEIPPPLARGRPLRWDEIFVLCAAGVVGSVGLVLWGYHCWGGRSGRRRARAIRREKGGES